MSRWDILLDVLAHPKEIVTLGYMALARKRAAIDHERRIFNKYGIRQLPTIDLLDIAPGLCEGDTIGTYSFLPNTSGLTDMLLLRALAKRYKACEYFEIGSFRGESLSAIAEVARHCTSLTLSTAELRALGLPDDEVSAYGVFFKDIPNLTSIFHNSQTYDFGKHDKRYDLLFVDGDHTYGSVRSDTANVHRLLKDDSSIIVWHDYSYNPVNVRHEVFEAILDGTPRHLHKHLYHVSNTMCAVLLRDRVETSLQKRQELNKLFSVSITGRRR